MIDFIRQIPQDILVHMAFQTAAFLVVFLFLEILYGKRIIKSDSPGVTGILRLFSRLLLVYLYIRLAPVPAPLVFPWNIVFSGTGSVILAAAILFPFFRLFDLMINRQDSDDKRGILIAKLLNLAGRGLKLTLWLLAFTLIVGKLKDLFPREMQNTSFFSTLILANGVLVACLILLVVRRTFSSSRSLLENRKDLYRLSIIFNSLTVPIQLIVPAVTVLWIKSVYPLKVSLVSYLDKSVYFLFLLSILVFLYKITEIVGSRLSTLSQDDTNALDKTYVEMIRMILRILLILAGLFGVIRIMTGKPLTTLLAGLGIGGLALALAAQDTLKNFFGSLMLMTDKPFKIGERILVMDYDGVIESIGFRSTRIRTLAGHQVVIPNDRMASASIENIARRPSIKRTLNIGLTYSTTPEKMNKALAIVREILENHEGMTEDFPPRVYFSDFNDDSLNLLVLYWYFPADYWQYMDFSEKVNLRIMEEFNREGIEFAFPTTTAYLEQRVGESFHLKVEEKREE